MGGSAAIELAARAPKLVSRLILQRHRAVHPEGAAQAPRADARAPLPLPQSRRPAARIGASQKNDGPSATTSAST
jgi:pimeloyl-ACP methyl ester carboxylesterase